jgi:Ran GTPase-activating protein (RanGAP) involved in mRNA processing and transport
MKNLCTGIKLSRTLVSLDLSSRVKSQQKNHFGIKGARLLGEVLASERCLLTHLALEGCCFGNEGLRALFGNLTPESTLLSLNLACNDLDASTPSFN